MYISNTVIRKLDDNINLLSKVFSKFRILSNSSTTCFENACDFEYYFYLCSMFSELEDDFSKCHSELLNIIKSFDCSEVENH